jgi:hypothetical protein
MIVLGFVLFSVVYGGFAFVTHIYFFMGLLFLYGIYAACSESLGKAWISNMVDKSETATAIGSYTALNSVLTMVASSFAGLVWFLWGAMATMMVSGVAVLLVAIYFVVFVPEKQ